MKLQHRAGIKYQSLGYRLRMLLFGHTVALPAWGKSSLGWGFMDVRAESYHSSLAFGSFLCWGIPGTHSAASGGGWLEKQLCKVHREPPDPSQV